MCDPITIGLIAVAGLKAGGQAYEAQEQYRIQKQARHDNAVVQSRSAIAEALASYSQLNRRQQEEERAANEAITDATRRSMEARGTLLAQGASGGSSAALVSEFDRHLGEYRARTLAELQSRTLNIQAERDAQGRLLSNRLQQARGPAVMSPNYLSIAMNFAQSALGTLGSSMPATSSSGTSSPESSSQYDPMKSGIDETQVQGFES